MKKYVFERNLDQLPGLTAQGFMPTDHPLYAQKRQQFLDSATYFKQSLDAMHVLKSFGKAQLISSWQEDNCKPSKLKDLIEWHSGKPVSIGAIILAAYALGFELHRKAYSYEPSFNMLARQVETELRQLKVRQMIGKMVS
jgi:hypothetical protein